MSSHHIVREKQEPALLIADLDGFDPENLGQLLEWSPTIIVAEDAYDSADSLGIKIDFLVGRPDEYSLQPRTQLIPSEEHAIQSALDFLTREKYPAVNIITGKPVITDYLPYCDHINIVILTIKQRIFMVRSGFSKWKTAGEDIEILGNATELVHTGLDQNSSHMFTTQSDGFYSLRFQESFIFVAENL
ncbi:thiamine pyrophosphokinase [Arcticibacter pallidicorallinus]|uniref:Thiamine pyrophosphokinase n=1 Tax=Arcticibacter pallidicorallinus TaxID=1259464 RepID=A0A2T0U7B1_9SPHI|nr:thiamine diphosphokinase [Arcticibacter pallidicorallinus]PRY53799.1 thiamine pyrophosphokinase [Arcticibacter pallidicorallinus]